MAISIESASLVRQKTRRYTLNPAVSWILKAFFTYHSTNKDNADLELIYIDDADVTGTDGVVAADAACVVYVLYVTKRATATDSYFKLFDDATDDSAAGDERYQTALLEASEPHIAVWPSGLTCATGVVLTSHTTSNGTTDSTAGDSGDGFIIIGASGAN
jgi:hypothetical protein